MPARDIGGGGDAGDYLTLVMTYDTDDYAAPAVGDLVELHAAGGANREVILATHVHDVSPFGKVQEVQVAGTTTPGVGRLLVNILKYSRLALMVEDGSCVVGSGVQIEATPASPVKVMISATTTLIAPAVCIGLYASATAAAGADGGYAEVLFA